jgi:DNA processing protein
MKIQGGQAPRISGAELDLRFCLGKVESAARWSAVMTDLADFVALSLLPLWCRLRTAECLREGLSPGAILQRLLHVHWSGEPERAAALRADAEAAVKLAQEGRIRAVTWSDPAYPIALTTIADPPPLLWVRGAIDALSLPSVAIVGSRAASPYGLSVAAQLASDLAARGLIVVSGLARGVDSAAHRGALAVGGTTVAVLGSGADVIYPPEHAALADEITVQGAVISELVPGTPPLPWCFPLRNRIISGLSRAVVVIEAGEKSGSLITARCALEQGREVLAVPGNVLSGRNRGAHALLRDGAKIVESADDILDELGMAPSPPRGQTLDTDSVLACLPPGEACDLDLIAERSGLQPSRLLPRLFELELQGQVRRVGGGRFVRMDRTC